MLESLLLPWADQVKDFDNEVMNALELVDATLDGTVTYEMLMKPMFSNLNGMFVFAADGSN